MAKAKRRFPVAAPALEPLEVPAVMRTIYPPPHDKIVQGRAKRRLASVLGLTDFGVNITTLAAGAASSMRHWHSGNDEFIYVLDGEVTLVTDAGSQLLVTGMCAGFPKGTKDAHHLVNQGDRPVTYMEVGTNHEPDIVGYPDQKLFLLNDRSGKPVFTKTMPKTVKAKAKKKK